MGDKLLPGKRFLWTEKHIIQGGKNESSFLSVNNGLRQVCGMCPWSLNFYSNRVVEGLWKEAEEKSQDDWSGSGRVASLLTTVYRRYNAGGWVRWTALVLSNRVFKGMLGKEVESEHGKEQGFGGGKRRGWPQVAVRINGEVIEVALVNNLKYLGSCFRGGWKSAGRCENEWEWGPKNLQCNEDYVLREKCKFGCE